MMKVLALSVAWAHAARDEANEAWTLCEPDHDAIDAAFAAKIAAQAAYVQALELHFRAASACDDGDIAAQLEVMAALGARFGEPGAPANNQRVSP